MRSNPAEVTVREIKSLLAEAAIPYESYSIEILRRGFKYRLHLASKLTIPASFRKWDIMKVRGKNAWIISAKGLKEMVPATKGHRAYKRRNPVFTTEAWSTRRNRHISAVLWQKGRNKYYVVAHSAFEEQRIIKKLESIGIDPE